MSSSDNFNNDGGGSAPAVNKPAKKKAQTKQKRTATADNADPDEGDGDTRTKKQKLAAESDPNAIVRAVADPKPSFFEKAPKRTPKANQNQPKAAKVPDVQFVEYTDGSIGVHHISIKFEHKGPNPIRVRPAKGEFVYQSDRTTTEAEIEFEPLSSSAKLLLTKIIGSDEKSIVHYDGQMFEADKRLPTNSKDAVSNALKKDLDPTVPPVHNINAIFNIIAKKATELKFGTACKPFMEQGLRVVTMCSGTESPLLAMDMLNDALVHSGEPGLPVDHLASAEIEPFKQAYIHRNFAPKVLFRDVTEFSHQDEKAHTAFGGWAEQPKDVHILIAGSSCIDYSSLNTSKKDFGDKGESISTLKGVLDYAARYKPNVVIIENVEGAPWDDIVNEWDARGYFGVVVFVDSKDFYIPQTRQRGYMVGFNKHRADVIGLDLKQATQKLIQCINHLCQRASAPYQDFIFGDDDPELKLARLILSRTDGKKDSNTDWAACRVRYAAYRIQHLLGPSRPVSQWKNGGKSQFLDYAWKAWARAQRERILDTLDINFLAYVSERHYDMTYKSRFIELSQNVDRDQDSRHWGLVGCITPSGMPWDSFRGGPVFGREVLALQGIPVDTLSLNNETSQQLQDLAGNAMTTTVIGCITISAIIASYVGLDQPAFNTMTKDRSMFERFNIVSNIHSQDKKLALFRPQGDVSTLDQFKDRLILENSMEHSVIELESETLDLTELKKLAALTLPLCKCDYWISRHKRNFWLCELCGHTACDLCVGNPRHQYVDITVAVRENHQKAEKFTQAVTSIVPSALKINLSSMSEANVKKILGNARSFEDHRAVPDKLYPTLLNDEDSKRYFCAVTSALNSTVYHQSTKQESEWRMIFEAPNARLEFRFSLQGSPYRDSSSQKFEVSSQWLVYAKPDAAEPAVSIVRDHLLRPVARMIPNGNNILHGKWQFWDPSMPYASLDIQGIGPPVEAWESRIGLQKHMFRDLKSFSQLKVTAIPFEFEDDDLSAKAKETLRSLSGQFDALIDCGSACGSLYRRSSPNNNNQHSSAYLFLDAKPLQNRFLDRMTFASTHSRLPYGVNRQIAAELVKAWRPNSLNIKSDSTVAAQVPCRLVEIWHDHISISLGSAITKKDTAVWMSSIPKYDTDGCQNIKPLLLANLSIDKLPQPQWSGFGPYKIDLIDQPAALKDFQSILKRLSIKALENTGQDSIRFHDDNCPCQTCLPHAPKLKWCYTRKRSKKLVDKATIRPFEDPEEATRHERLLSDRPVPVVAEVYTDNDDALLVVGLNLSTVVHRLGGKLELGRSRGEFTWKFKPYDGFEDIVYLPKIDLATDETAPLWPHDDAAYMLNKSHVKTPTLFRSDRTLWDNQRRAMTWMFQVEQGLRWNEWDAEYFNIPSLGLQLQVEAEKKVVVRGAIVADEVGAGKTTTSLALVARGLEDLPAHDKIPDASGARRLRSRATVILVPSNIQNQWLDEIEACLRMNHVKVCTFSLLQRKNFPSVSEIQSADILLVPWNIFQTGTGKYWRELSEFCCAPNWPKDAGRAFNQWLDAALEDLGDIVESCGIQIYESQFLDHRESQQSKRKEKYKAFCAFSNDDTGLTSKEKQCELDEQIGNISTGHIAPDAIDDDEKTFDKTFEQLAEWDPDKERLPLLHLFEFERIIVDEFTYIKPQGLRAILTLSARMRWMLSGTPPIADTRSINAMANLIGTKVAIEPTDSSKFSFKDTRSIGTAEKTYAEEFREKIRGYSPAWDSARNGRSVAFVEQFVRQNPAPPPVQQKFDQYIVLPQSTLEAYLLNKAFQFVTGPPLRFGAKPPGRDKLKKLNREERFRQRLQEAETPEAALLSCHVRTMDLYLKDQTAIPDKIICRELIAEMSDIVDRLRKQITETLQGAFWYWNIGPSKVDDAEKSEHLCTYLHCILNRTFGDSVASELLSHIAAYARANPVKPPPKEPSTKKPSAKKPAAKKPSSKEQLSTEESSDDEPSTNEKTENPNQAETKSRSPDRKKIMQDMATALNNMSLELVAHIQQLRLLQAISAIVDRNPVMTCDACEQSVRISELSLLSQCGHTICSSCLEAPAERSCDVKGCPADQCTNSSKDSSVPAQSYINEADSSTYGYGSKMEAVINKIESIDKKDCILIFIQSNAERNQLIAALSSSGIGFEDGTRYSDNVIKRFRKRTEDSKKVLILRIDSEDSAGWNLQIANHVMFVTPFLTKTQYDYEATMTQAIGRAFRFGQKKDVMVYHFLLTMTMDVNIVQERTGKRLVKGENGEYKLVEVSHKLAMNQPDLAGPSVDGILHVAAGEDDDDEDDDEDDGAD